MRIYITGCVGSGKSTLARRLSALTGIPCTHLDEIVYESDPASASGSRKRDEGEREHLFREVLARLSPIKAKTVILKTNRDIENAGGA